MSAASRRSVILPISRMMLAPKTSENRHRILPSASTCITVHTHRLAPSEPPVTVGSSYDAPYIPIATMFISRIPSSATPRSVSMAVMRSVGATGLGPYAGVPASAGAVDGNIGLSSSVTAGFVTVDWLSGLGRGDSATTIG
jgi:hypothetical protein